jgi:rhodanese-related sulfurtransferase
MGLARAMQPKAEETPTALLPQTTASSAGDLRYAGDVTPQDAYSFLESHHAILVDVRTIPEWQFTGVPDISGTKGKLATISWKHYPDFARNVNFANDLATVPGISKETPLLFICRSGGRSADAAIAMTAAGYRYCFNIEDGFEGEPDAQGHRGAAKGWKAKKLPWKQG